MTETYPDIIEFIKENLPEDVENFIMDTEIVAVDKKSV
jgi:ATP-dependent DNA ligase